MPAQWTGEIVGKMHMHGIKIQDLAKQLGVTREYTGAVLNGKRTPPNAETRFNAALDALLALQEDSTTYKAQ